MIKLLLLLLAFPLTAKDYKITDGKVSFVTTANPGIITIEGTGGKPTGNLKVDKELVSGSFKIALADFTTGLGLRDKHLKGKYLDVIKFPEAEFSFLAQKDDGSIDGELKIKSDTHKQLVSYSVKDGNVYAKMRISLKDYPSIGIPSYLGVTVADFVDIDTEFPYKP